MTVGELTNIMYYGQKLRILECDSLDRLKKKLVYEGDNHGLRSCKYKSVLVRKVIGFGIGQLDNTIDINIE